MRPSPDQTEASTPDTLYHSEAEAMKEDEAPLGRADDEHRTYESDDACEKATTKDEHAPPQREANDAHSVSSSDAGFNLPWRTKGPFLLCLLFLTLGSNWANSALGPLKSTLKREMHLTNSQYGVIASAHSLINSCWPLISGILIDYYGPAFGTVMCSTFVFLGCILTAIGASTNSYGLFVFAQIVFGLGNMALESAQSKYYAHFTKGTLAGGRGYLAFINGLDIGVGRIFGVGGSASAVPIEKSTGKYEWTFYISAILAGFTLLLNIGFVFLERHLPQNARLLSGRRRVALGLEGTSGGSASIIRRRLQVAFGGLLCLPSAFWLLAVTQMLQAGTVQAYLSNSADMIKVTRGSSTLTAGYTSSLSQLIPIFLTPALGLFMDRFGLRVALMSFTALIWITVFSTLGFTLCHPLIPTIIGSLALSLNVLPFLASIPLLVTRNENLGVAYGLWKSFNSAGTTIMEVTLGVIQDQAPKTSRRQYDKCFYFMIAIKAVDVFYGAAYHIIDRQYLGSVLFYSERRRLEAERAQGGKRRDGLRAPNRFVSYFGMACAAAIIVTAYVVYIYYAI